MSGMSKAKSSIALQITLATGTTVSSDITVSGIETEDTLIFVGHITTAAAIATLADDTANCSITASGVIQSTTNTTTDQMMVFWLDNSL